MKDSKPTPNTLHKLPKSKVWKHSLLAILCKVLGLVETRGDNLSRFSSLFVSYVKTLLQSLLRAVVFRLVNFTYLLHLSWKRIIMTLFALCIFYPYQYWFAQEQIYTSQVSPDVSVVFLEKSDYVMQEQNSQRSQDKIRWCLNILLMFFVLSWLWWLR